MRTRLFNQACKYLEAEDRRADPLFFVLREADAKDLRDRLAERALALRKKKQYAGALLYLRLLGRDPALGEELRFRAGGLQPEGVPARVVGGGPRRRSSLSQLHV